MNLMDKVNLVYLMNLINPKQDAGSSFASFQVSILKCHRTTTRTRAPNTCKTYLLTCESSVVRGSTRRRSTLVSRLSLRSGDFARRNVHLAILELELVPVRLCLCLCQ